MDFQVSEWSHIGSRDQNEDFVCHTTGTNWGCFMVADGLGGHEAGDVASRYFLEAVQKLCGQYAKAIESDPVNGIDDLLAEAGARFRHRVATEFGLIDTQTTFTFAWISDKHFITAHVGDSRVYRIHDNKVIWRTPDHTIAQKYLEQGKITEADLADHPMQNRLLKAINTFEKPKAEIFVHPPLAANDAILLCTDGFWAALDEEKVAQLAQSKQQADLLKEMVEQMATHNPVSDNVTAQWVALRA